MSAGDTARASYNAVRIEIIQRMQLRDYVLLVFLGFTSAIFGVAFGAPNRLEILLTIPFLSLGAAILVSQHNLMAAVLGNFLTEELEPMFKVLSESAPQWDNSATFKEYAGSTAKFRFVGHNLIIFIPCVIALCVNFRAIFTMPFPEGHIWSFIWGFGAFCVGLSVYVIWHAHSLRMEMYEKRGWEKSKFKDLTEHELNDLIEKCKEPTYSNDVRLQQLELQQLECEKFRRMLHLEND